MRLRLRSFESKQTLKIDVPNPCTLSQLKQILAQSFHNSPSPDSIRLSLNRKDELQSDGGDSLQSLGIAAGDLIYFSLEQSAAEAMIPSPRILLPQVTASTSLSTQNSIVDSAISGMDSEKGESSVRVSETIEEMEVDGEDNIETDVVVGKSFSVPGFLRKVFIAELGDDAGKDHKLIIIAIHAVMLEAGFVGFDKKAKIEVNGFSFSNEWPSSLLNVSLCYTLPESLSKAASRKTVVLKFQTLGKFINVYGTLENGAGKKNSTCRVQLDEDQLVSFLNVVWANCGEEAGGIFCLLEKKVFEFWKTVKDNIALPLLIDLCDEIGLTLPPCFMRLPTDLKMKILESLSGVDVAKASCVCSELRYLGSSDDLWKMKFVEEFGNAKTHVQGTWKMGYYVEMELRKIRKVNRARSARALGLQAHQAQRRRYPNPYMVPRVPRMIGGDYDIGGDFAPQCNFNFLG